MKKLDNIINGVGEVRGFLFTKIKENDYVYLYKVEDTTIEDGECIWYEVFEKKISKECDNVIGGLNIHFEAKEIYPKSNSFGVWAFTETTYPLAIKKMEELTNICKTRELKKLKTNG